MYPTNILVTMPYNENIKALTLDCGNSLSLWSLAIFDDNSSSFHRAAVLKLSDMMVVGGWDDFKRAKVPGMWLPEHEG